MAGDAERSRRSRRRRWRHARTRSRRARRPHLRPVSGHALAGLQGRGGRERALQRRGRRDQGRDPHLRGGARGDLLLLHFGWTPRTSSTPSFARCRSGGSSACPTRTPSLPHHAGRPRSPRPRATAGGGWFVRLKTLQRGVSPRVVRAQVIGTRGRRTVSGPHAPRRPAGHVVHPRARGGARRGGPVGPARKLGPHTRRRVPARPARARWASSASDLDERWRTVAHVGPRVSAVGVERPGRYRGQGPLELVGPVVRALALLAVTLPGAAPAAERPAPRGGGRRAARAVRRHPRRPATSDCDCASTPGVAVSIAGDGVPIAGSTSARGPRASRRMRRPGAATVGSAPSRPRAPTGSAGVRTPSCARRLALRVLRRARSGRSVRLRRSTAGALATSQRGCARQRPGACVLRARADLRRPAVRADASPGAAARRLADQCRCTAEPGAPYAPPAAGSGCSPPATR